MTYNLHPLFVHFPIALLFLYSILKILPLNKWFPNVSWKHIERALLFFGVLGAFVALYTGGVAQDITQMHSDIVNVHSNFAVLATCIYGLLLFGEIISFIKTKYASVIQSKKILLFLAFTEKFLCDSIFSKLLALLGLVAISVTGMLGGVMVYGASADPIVPIVLKLLGINI